MYSNYWSCTKFADWIRGTPKLQSGSTKEWNDWEKSAQQKQFRYWLAEDGLDHLQNFLFFPKNRFDDICHYIDNRWMYRTHALTSNLEKGSWHDFDNRMLYSSFDSLVDYVEIELAGFYMACSTEASKKYATPWYRSLFKKWRCPESGLEHLHWAESLRHNEEWIAKDDPNFDKPTEQAIAASETIKLYTWWKEVRPKHPDPMDASGWSDFCEERRKNAEASGDDSSFSSLYENETDEEQVRSRKILDICHKMESEQEEEDTEMLIRLVKLRHRLWC